MMTRLNVFLALSFLASACTTPPNRTAVEPKAPVAEAEANLIQGEAERRRGELGEISYRFDVHLIESQATFAAKTTIDFELKSVSDNLFLDFKNGAAISRFSVNGASVEAGVVNHRLALPAGALKTGRNHAEVSYTQTFGHDGRGLHRFRDPEDGKVYLYTQFEAYDAHQMFPCFDQPDLKGTLTMTVRAPRAWQVITTMREHQVRLEGTERVWDFPATPKLSTYLFSLHAGPYHRWEAAAGAIPLRLFARESLARYVAAEDWFAWTRRGLKYYGAYFAVPYPFNKYDQVIAPDFNAGAMENAGAVTFTESIVKRGPMTRENRRETAGVILHEMAHMWFGDLVTMRWWNGLWLNESFATYLSTLALVEATEFKESWAEFFGAEKQWAYFYDQLVTTHPIEALVPDVATGSTNFDAITYGKGAAALKQLSFLLGRDTFRDGVRRYVRDHAYQNTSLADFIAALGAAAGRDLRPWSKAWLESAGLDSVAARFECAGGRLKSFVLTAAGPDGRPTPRTHRTRVRLYDAELRAGPSADVEYVQGDTPVARLVGAMCPSFVDPNDDDHDFVKIKYDQISLATLRSRAMRLENRFSRLRVWLNLMQMVRDQELAPRDYLRIAQLVVARERDLISLELIQGTLGRVLYFLADATANERRDREVWVQRMEDALWARFAAAPGGSDAQKLFFDAFVTIAESGSGRDHLARALTRGADAPNFTPDLDRQWRVIIRLAQLGDARAPGALRRLRSTDTSDRGVLSARAAEAAGPRLELKREWFDKILTQTDLKLAHARVITRPMFPRGQASLLAALGDDFYARLPAFASRANIEMVQLFVDRFNPALCTSESAARLARFLKETPGLPIAVVKDLRVTEQEDSRCWRIREKFGAADPAGT